MSTRTNRPAQSWTTRSTDTRTTAEDGPGVDLLPPLGHLDTPEDAAALLTDPLMPSRIAALLRPTEAV